MIETDIPLTEVLRRRGYTHRKTTACERGVSSAHDILKDGQVVFTGAAGAVWEWLYELEPDSGSNPCAQSGS